MRTKSKRLNPKRTHRYHKYRRDVKRFTSSAREHRPDLRPRYGHTLDHIVPVTYGFTHGIAAERIGSAENLKMVPAQENLQKGSMLTPEGRALLKAWADYPADWKEIARRAKDEAEWCCIRCGHAHAPEKGYMLTVHHIDMDKSNCRWWNLAALCQRCHLTIQARVKINRVWMFDHSEWFRPYVAGYYAFLRGDDDSREAIDAALVLDPESALSAPLL